MSETILSDPNKPSLAVHEWLAITAIICFMITLTGFSFFFNQEITNVKTGSPYHLKPQEIEVKVEGAVEYPGIIKIKPGATRLEAIEMAKPSPNADLRKIKSSKVRNGQVIIVPSKQMIQISVSGAVVSPETIKIPKGTRLQDLSGFIALSPEADAAKMNKKRFIKEGETIVVPERKVK